MASKPVDNSVNERRLRPIYGNYRVFFSSKFQRVWMWPADVYPRLKEWLINIRDGKGPKFADFVWSRHVCLLVCAHTILSTIHFLLYHSPFTDWLDNGMNKKAFQEAEKVLKKQPNLQCAKVTCWSCCPRSTVSIYLSLEISGAESVGTHPNREVRRSSRDTEGSAQRGT